MPLCSACRSEKPETEFNKNKSNKSGLDCYCKGCRHLYYKNGRSVAWPTRKERRLDLLTRGLKRCCRCKETKEIAEFYSAEHGYCRPCHSIKSKESYEKVGRDRMRRYNKRPDVIARLDAQRRATPRTSLSIRLNHALKRRPTDNAVTIDDLLEIWRDQDGKCAVSGLLLTWKGGTTTPTSISIDRIDSAKGYTRDNVRLICCQVNTFKNRWSDEQMFNMALAIVNNMKRPKLRLVS